MEERRLIRLKTYSGAFRKPWIAIDGGEFQARLPTYFGSHVLRVPLAEVVVADPEAPQRELPGDSIFVPPLRLPYFFTTGPLTSPTTLLLFRYPARVPPLRLSTAMAPTSDLPFGYRESRSAAGATIDGMFVRVDDPDLALATLRDGGVPAVDAAEWLLRHRERMEDPLRIEKALAEERRAVMKARVSGGLFFGALAFTWFVQDDPSPAQMGGVGGTLAVCAWLRWSAGRDIKRALSQES